MSLPSISDVASLGGIKANMEPVVDPTTDEDADHRNTYVFDTTALGHTGCRAWYTFIPGAAPTEPVSNVHDSMWGDANAVKPTVTRTAQGVYEVEWPDTITNELSEDHILNIRRCWVSVEVALGASPPLQYTVERIDAHTVKVYLYNADGTTLTETAIPTYYVTVFWV